MKAQDVYLFLMACPILYRKLARLSETLRADSDTTGYGKTSKS
jgi:hypothetical protein